MPTTALLQALHRKSRALVCFTTPGGGDPTAALQAQQPLEPTLAALRDRLAEQTAFLERHSRELEATLEVCIYNTSSFSRPLQRDRTMSQYLIGGGGMIYEC